MSAAYLHGHHFSPIHGPLAIALQSLDQLKSALKVVAALGDGAIGVPGLRAAAGTAIEIINIAQAVTKNKEDAVEVAKSAAERTASLLDAFKGKSRIDVPLDLQYDVVRYAGKLELVQKILRKHAMETSIWRRILARISNRDEINQCKDILNESFQVFEISLSLKLHTRLPDLLNQLKTFITAQVPGNYAAADVVHRLSTKPTPPPTSTALDNASRNPRPTPPTALKVMNIISTTQLRWTQRRRSRALGDATRPPLPSPPWSHGAALAAMTGRCRI
ncbi:hypothetical protein DFH09DRAFT_1355254 [Mycena vulgaris]|nr:hypothetical protein DFH09DRAFT_1355254 [Mycena vulgaris]